MSKLAPAHALSAVESPTAASAITRATVALARLRANVAARDSVAEYDLLSARAECYIQRGDTAAAAADLAEMARLAQELNDLPRQLAAVTRLYEHERRARDRAGAATGRARHRAGDHQWDGPGTGAAA